MNTKTHSTMQSGMQSNHDDELPKVRSDNKQVPEIMAFKFLFLLNHSHT
jgi:hypothetical protein